MDALEGRELQAEGFGLHSGVGPEGTLDRAKVRQSVMVRPDPQVTSSWMFPNFNQPRVTELSPHPRLSHDFTLAVSGLSQWVSDSSIPLHRPFSLSLSDTAARSRRLGTDSVLSDALQQVWPAKIWIGWDKTGVTGAGLPEASRTNLLPFQLLGAAHGPSI